MKFNFYFRRRTVFLFVQYKETTCLKMGLTVAATAPEPEAGHNCRITVPDKSEQIRTAFHGHPSTHPSASSMLPKGCPQATHMCRDPNMACHIFFFLPSDNAQWNHCPSHQLTHVDLQTLTISSLLPHAHRTVRYLSPKTWEMLDQSTLLKLKITNSIKTENTWQKQHRTVKKISNYLTWFDFNSSVIYCHKTWSYLLTVAQEIKIELNATQL